MSISPSGHRQLRSRTVIPAATRCAAATCSPYAPNASLARNPPPPHPSSRLHVEPALAGTHDGRRERVLWTASASQRPVDGRDRLGYRQRGTMTHVREPAARMARRSRSTVQSRLLRLRQRSFLICQVAVAAGVAWFIAHDLLDHQRPFFAPVAAIVSLGMSYGQRLRRVGEVTLGVAVGAAWPWRTCSCASWGPVPGRSR